MALVDEILNDYRGEVLTRDSAVQTDYVRRWLKIEEALKDKVEALIFEVQTFAKSGQPVPIYQLQQLQRYQELLAQSQDEILRFMRFTEGNISGLQQTAIQDGLDLGVESINKIYGQMGIDVSFDRLNAEAAQTMFGFSQKGAPLYELLTADYPQTMVQLTDALMKGVAIGQNPRVTARDMFSAMAGNLGRAFTVARTEQMRALRFSQLAEYRNSGYVEQYERVSAKSTRTCLACLLEDGRIYKIDETMSDHPNGRCLFVVKPAGYNSGRLNGKEYFQQLSAIEQRNLMGNERFAAWQRGEIALSDMSRMHNHPIWGESPRLVPMEELINA